MKEYLTATIKLIIKTIKIAAILLIMAILSVVGVITLYYFYSKPSTNDFDDDIWWEYRWNKDENGECIIDLAEVVDEKWDSAKYYSMAYEYKDICNELKLNNIPFQDVGSRIYFMYKGKIIYYVVWFPYPPEYTPKTVRITNQDKLTIYPHNAKFKAYKSSFRDYEDKYIYLKQIK